ncbi:ribosomal L1 domain-containing protein 1-like [Ptychodera flava]|uniref:ribosomal L1 domain-containing protein 1-like n=1 Tax=Ptychodera flava TaxID=63121 RepID=UPI00396AAFB1
MATEDHVDAEESRKSQLCKDKVGKAVRAIYKQHELLLEKKKSLFGNTAPIYLQVTLWEVPVQKKKRFKLSVPHGVRGKNCEVCLITKDEREMDREQCAKFYKKLLAQKGVKNISHVMSLQTLRKEYRPFEARRKLVQEYDLFLADERIFRLLDSCTGKEFHKKQKYPVAVDVMKTDLAKEIETSINTAYFIMVGRGSCSGVRIGHTDLTEEQTVENVMASVESLTSKIPKGWPNIKCLYIKTQKSMAIPIYATTDFSGTTSEGAHTKVSDKGAAEDMDAESGYEDESDDNEAGSPQKRKQSASEQTSQKKQKTAKRKKAQGDKKKADKTETKIEEKSPKKKKLKASKMKKSQKV